MATKKIAETTIDSPLTMSLSSSPAISIVSHLTGEPPVLRFAILIHDHPCLHWDLLVEQGGVLRSWRLLESPERWLLATSPTVLNAEGIADHRLVYLDYEGPVSRERGSVQRWDSGHVEWLEESPEVTRLKLSGVRLRGVLRLRRVTAVQQSFVGPALAADFADCE